MPCFYRKANIYWAIGQIRNKKNTDLKGIDRLINQLHLSAKLAKDEIIKVKNIQTLEELIFTVNKFKKEISEIHIDSKYLYRIV